MFLVAKLYTKYDGKMLRISKTMLRISEQISVEGIGQTSRSEFSETIFLRVKWTVYKSVCIGLVEIADHHISCKEFEKKINKNPRNRF